MFTVAGEEILNIKNECNIIGPAGVLNVSERSGTTLPNSSTGVSFFYNTDSNLMAYKRGAGSIIDIGTQGITGPSSALDLEICRFNGTNGSSIEGAGVRHYDNSATNPTVPAPNDGDLYYNTAINHYMYYDGSRGKWLSIATLTDGFGRNGSTAVNVFYRRFNGMQTSLTLGPFVQKGTIVGMGFTTSSTVNHTFELLVNGAVVSSLASVGTASASNFSLNDDFNAGTMSGRNGSGSGTTTFFQVVVYYKLRP
jgi:hypothetical protein